MTNKSYSTTKRLTTDKPRLKNSANAKFESFLILPPNHKRIAESGLRTKGLFKSSYKDKPLITVVTVVFNGEEFLEETIVSVLNQSYDNVEYIIIDGGSTDGTLDIIKKYDAQIDYWISEPDGGIYDAMNKGISLATGDWINFMNTGDSFFSKNSILTLIKSSQNSDVVYGGRNNIYPKYSLLYNAKLFEEAKFCLSFSHQSCIIRSSVHKKYLYDTSFIVSGDTDFFFRLRYLRYRFKKVDSIICNSDMSGISSIVDTNLRKEKLRIVKQYKLGIFSYVVWEIYRSSITKIKKLPFIGHILMKFKHFLFEKKVSKIGDWMNNSYEIDVVILWVDGGNEQWREKKNKYDTRKNVSDENRFQDWGTLKFVLRGIETFMPWVRKIHLVTEGHVPNWLKKPSKLNHITHEMFFKNKNDLPTFNSNAIELNLGWLESLSEHFILFNDDMFVLKPCKKERFFKNGLPVDFLVQSISREGYLFKTLKGKPEYNEMLVNNITAINKFNVKQDIKNWQLFSKNYNLLSNFLNLFFKIQSPNKIPWLNTYHHPQAHLKSTFIKMWKKEKKLRDTSKNRFRTNNDLTHWLCRFVNLVEGDFYPSEFNDHQSIYYRKINDLQKIKNSTTFLCVSDDVTDEFPVLSEALAEYLSRILPKASSFEKNHRN